MGCLCPKTEYCLNRQRPYERSTGQNPLKIVWTPSEVRLCVPPAPLIGNLLFIPCAASRPGTCAHRNLVIKRGKKKINWAIGGLQVSQSTWLAADERFFSFPLSNQQEAEGPLQESGNGLGKFITAKTKRPTERVRAKVRSKHKTRTSTRNSKTTDPDTNLVPLLQAMPFGRAGKGQQQSNSPGVSPALQQPHQIQQGLSQQQQQQQQQQQSPLQHSLASGVAQSSSPANVFSPVDASPKNPIQNLPIRQSSNSSFDLRFQQQQQAQLQQQQQQQQQQPSPSPQIDFDQVGRSQSHRFPHQPPPPTYAVASSSFDDLHSTHSLAVSSPLLQQGQHNFPTSPLLQHPQHQHLQQLPLQQQSPPVETRKSTRKLVKNIFSSSRSSDNSSQHHAKGSIDQGPPQVQRRASQRVSQTFHSRSSAPQSTLDQQQQQLHQLHQQQQQQQQPPSDWQSQLSSPDLAQLNARDPLRLGIRQVQTDLGPASYSQGDQAALYNHQQQSGSSQELSRTQGQSHFDSSGHQHQQFQLQTQQFHNHPSGPPPVYTGGHLGPNSSNQNPETISQLSRDSPVTDSEQIAVNLHSSQNSPAVNYPSSSQDLSNPGTQHQHHPHQEQDQGQNQILTQGQGQTQQSQPHQQQHQSRNPLDGEDMAPPGQPGQPPIRRSQDAEKGMRGQQQMEPPPGPPPNYRHSQSSSANPMQQSGPGGMPQNYSRGGASQDRQFNDAQPGERTSSPQPEAVEPDKAFKELLTKYKNVKRLYFDGKNQIEGLNNQVEQLQNAVANQRISQSRTALDDNEYTTRFNRLNGAINNLSFNIRKDWVMIPPLLDGFVSADALRTGKQEMTAVGRAAITHWVVEFVFNKCFHPGLPPDLSRELKHIEQNIRTFSYTLNSQEEYDALTSKVVSWRMATLEGLQPVLQSSRSAEHRVEFTRLATEGLTNKLFEHLTNPPPPGVDGSVSMIVELAVGIAANLPLESRDVAVTYPLPGSQINPSLMEVEKTGLPALELRTADGEGAGDSDEQQEDRIAAKDGKAGQKSGASRVGDKAAKSGMSSTLSNILGGSSRKGSVASVAGQRQQSISSTSIVSNGGTDVGISAAASSSTTNLLSKEVSNKIRYAGFVVVEVRGRQVLVKAPVWSIA
ncbi:uncharacterized protein PgNI_03218 [Pyricularia grisea]|uniref:S-adenosylmethionine-dependent methyltransferase-like protein n=1 Tax=Pyricularia grisea TaxID=148305 RepID=A0A6P8B8A8_PYRGI|nr:uncharacterized protein PgNI_03218 [Pyricularia grisea]TLD12048.1 hypothetical protein PgNI_03218 [Pyricularia grisea]